MENTVEEMLGNMFKDVAPIADVEPIEPSTIKDDAAEVASQDVESGDIVATKADDSLAEIVETGKSETQISDDAFFEYFKTKTGREIKSFDELESRQEKEDFKYANDELAMIDKFVRETNRSAKDWYKMQELDVDNMSVEQKIKSKILAENPEFTAKEVELFYNRKFKKTTIDEDLMSDEEVSQALEDNAYVDILIKKEAAEAAKLLSKLKDDYKRPAPKQQDKDSDFDIAEFTNSWSSTIKGIESLGFELDSKRKLNWKIDENERKFFEKPIDPETWLKNYIKPDGNWDMQKWTTDVYKLQNMSRIIRSAAAARSAAEVEDLLDHVSNNVSKEERATSSAQAGAVSKGTKELAKAMWGR